MSAASATTVPSTDRQEGRRLGRAVLRHGLCFGALWLVCYALWAGLPYLRPGSDVIYAAKLRELQRTRILPPERPLRVVMFGNSLTLSGFIPEDFDLQVGRGCYSYNLGLPGRELYLAELQRLLASGQTPTHVLLQLPWPPAAQPKGWYAQLQDDKELVEAVFPFRKLPRDLTMFALQGGARNPAGTYRERQDLAAGVLAARGYYFIAGQSRFADHRLPAAYRLDTDRPLEVRERQVVTTAFAFQELRGLALRHGFAVLLMPEYYREGAYAEPPPVNAAVRQALAAEPRFFVCGPDYVRYGNDCFADPVHVNREGAQRYTARLATLSTAHLDAAAAAASGAPGGP